MLRVSSSTCLTPIHLCASIRTDYSPVYADVTDASGNPLFTIKKKLIAIHSTYNGFRPKTDETLFSVKSSFSLGTKLTATFKNTAGNGQETQLVLRGSILDRSAEITTKDGLPVARISRSFANAGEILCKFLHLHFQFSGLFADRICTPSVDKQTYILTVAPGVDAALLLAICICLDEKANDEK